MQMQRQSSERKGREGCTAVWGYVIFLPKIKKILICIAFCKDGSEQITLLVEKIML